MIIVKDLFKTYTTGKVETHVLKGISLHIKRHEFVAIMGKSGAGKSTLMYQMSLLDEPTAGQVSLDGTDTSTLTEKQRIQFRLVQLGYVFQDYALLPELTAVENVAIPLVAQGYSYTAAKIKAADTLDRLGLGHRLDNRPGQLSGGEQQRVSVARAVAHEPKILFADEPTANLDSVSSKAVLDTFAELHQTKDQTIVMVTHEPEYAEYADRIIYLEDGKIVEGKS
jgi:putative ABC transport system ATP-binding protein